MTLRTVKRIKKKKSVASRRSLEKVAIKALMLMAWAWILGFVGVIIWHLKQKRATTSSDVGGAPGTTSSNKKKSNIPPYTGAILTSNYEPNKNIRAPQQQQDFVLPPGGNYESPLLIFTCKRPEYLTDTLTDLYNALASPTKRPCQFGCPIIVSEDGVHEDVDAVILDFQIKFQKAGVPFYYIHHEQAKLRGSNAAYKALAQHYGWALKEVFSGRIDNHLPRAKRVIILEEDIHTAPDFLDYMETTSKLLDQDKTLFAVSAFNDNGHLVQDSKRLLRSDFFPGLGWMMTSDLWNELESKWPSAYWDDWLREPAQRQGRQIIRPEFSRTYHFGRQGGASKNQFGSILERIKLNTDMVDWSRQDVSYLSETTFTAQYGQLIFDSKKVSSLGEANFALRDGNARLEYKDLQEFQKLARQLDIMDDEKAGIPRTAYKGVVEIRRDGGNLLFLTPLVDEMRASFPGLSWS